MKAVSLLILLVVAIGAASIVPYTDGLSIDETKGAHLRRLADEEQPTTPSEIAKPEDAVTESDENHAWWHRGDGGCYRGSRYWPHCKSYRHLEEDLPGDVDEVLATEVGENHAPWHRGRGGCFPGSHLWPRCRGWGGRSDCFPGSTLWPSCRAWGGRSDCFPGSRIWPRCKSY
ncbi:hypothetical protein PC128_g17201 [Phytophthora cactorum]|nr:hypothetical protein PC128_g17201 [Phytophthora cactorum]